MMKAIWLLIALFALSSVAAPALAFRDAAAGEAGMRHDPGDASACDCCEAAPSAVSCLMQCYAGLIIAAPRLDRVAAAEQWAAFAVAPLRPHVDEPPAPPPRRA
jgi:hypothetical protein